MGHDPFRSQLAIRFTGDNIGDFLLHVLTVGLYNQPDLIIREYIQNSHDAICTWSQLPEPSRIDIKVQWPNIHIFDNGPGMDKIELVTAMSNLGKSLKAMSIGSGFMGIGKLAGVSMASRVEIHSSKYGVPEKHWITFESLEMLNGIMERRLKGEHHSILDTLHQHTKTNDQPLLEDPEKHYTSVHLLDINEDYRNKIENEDDFVKSIGLIAPVAQDPNFEYASIIDKKLRQVIPRAYNPISIFINGKPIYRPYIKGLGEPEYIMVLDNEDNITAYGWACLNTSSQPHKRQIDDRSLRGIALMQRGIVIGSRTLAEEMGLYSSIGNLIHFRWYCGELYITDPKIVVSTDRTRIRQNKYTSDFIIQASKEFRRLAKIAATWAEQDNASTAVQESMQKVTRIEDQIKSQPLTSDRIPRILSELGKTQAEIEKKKRYSIKPETKNQAEEVEKIVSSVLDQIANAQKSKTLVEQDNMIPISTFIAEQVPDADVLPSNSNEHIPGSDISFFPVSKNDKPIILQDIPEILAFSPRETRIYRTIMQAIADTCDGRSSELFTKLAEAIETALTTTFSDSEIDMEAL